MNILSALIYFIIHKLSSTAGAGAHSPKPGTSIQQQD
jgi:hypothetical protein